MKARQSLPDVNEKVYGIAPVLRSLLGADSLGRLRYSSRLPEVKNISWQKILLTADAPGGQEEIIAALREKLAAQQSAGVEIDQLGWFYKEDEKHNIAGRLSRKVALVTGAAQGFGAGIARLLAAEGAYVIIADINPQLAGEVADSLNREVGYAAAKSYYCDVADEASVQRLACQVVLEFGGIDLLISNAGVLRAGGLDAMTLPDFEFVTKINYTAFFLMAKYISQPMRLQSKADPGYFADIIQINSKSGLEGSNRNFAYAGSKFGGIGLVQSFARELVEERIKVNAICPGNYYEGPLWSDPEKGLFVQYLRSGKVPGAKTLEDVRRFYMEKVPMRRGCMPEDVVRAIIYCVEQQYETGQAVPVTGGQIMLS